jgi:hypothetical protein
MLMKRRASETMCYDEVITQPRKRPYRARRPWR